MTRKLKAVKFSDIQVGQRVYRNPGAVVYDERIEDIPKSHMHSGKVNVRGEDGYYAYFHPLQLVYIIIQE